MSSEKEIEFRHNINSIETMAFNLLELYKNTNYKTFAPPEIVQIQKLIVQFERKFNGSKKDLAKEKIKKEALKLKKDRHQQYLQLKKEFESGF